MSSPPRALLPALVALACVIGAPLGLVASASAASTATPSFEPGQSVYDPDGVLHPITVRTAESIADSIADASDIPLVLVARRVPANQTADGAAEAAAALAASFGLDDGVLFLLGTEPSNCGGVAAFARGRLLSSSELTDDVLDQIVTERVQPALAGCSPDTALLAALNAISGPLIRAGIATAGATPRPGASGPSNPAGPPFPDPEPGRYVYDQAGVFEQETLDQVQAQIQEIRDRTGAEMVVYTQQVPYGITTEEAEAHAQALMDQWGVGRRGFDDGLVILFDMDPSLEHGQVQLYAGPGYRATFLSNSERQAIFENEMLPHLQDGDLDAALLAAMEKIDANATPEHAASLARARTVNAIVGLVGTPLVFFGLVLWAAWSWIRFGRDPDYLDDPSILMPAPPPDLTAAAGALVMDGSSSRHTLTTAMLDLASRDEIAFQPEVRRFARDRLEIVIREPDITDARINLNRRKPISPAESYALGRLRDLSDEEDGQRIVDPDDLLRFGKDVATFDTKLEQYVERMGWYHQAPKKAVARWRTIGAAELIAGIAAIVGGFGLPADGLVLLGCGLIAAAIVTWVLARFMPARTIQGAMIRAMLAAYRRTLQKTMEMARSMNQVVESRAVPWLETPDQAVVWGVALGLHDEVERVFDRTIDDLRAGAATSSTYVPRWYGGWSTGGGTGGSGGFSGVAPGVFSGSAIPNLGGMMSAIGTIGNAPGSSGSGGGFGGGGSGGGGGGSGGGF